MLAVDGADSACTQSSWETEAIAKQAAAAWRAGRAQDGNGAQAHNASCAAHIGAQSGGSAACRLTRELSNNQRQSGRALRQSSSIAASINIRDSLVLREQRVVAAARDPLW
jgi:hypothetical protein